MFMVIPTNADVNDCCDRETGPKPNQLDILNVLAKKEPGKTTNVSNSPTNVHVTTIGLISRFLRLVPT